MSEEQLKRSKDNSLKEEEDALKSLEDYAGALGASDKMADSDEVSTMVKRTASAINAHRNSSENYTVHLEEKIRILEKRLPKG